MVGMVRSMGTSKKKARAEAADAPKATAAKRPRGRPEKEKGAKEDSIHIRVTGEQKERMAEEAERRGMSLSTWLLQLGLGEVEARAAQRGKAEGGAGAQ